MAETRGLVNDSFTEKRLERKGTLLRAFGV
jgi:hypothetical protein